MRVWLPITIDQIAAWNNTGGFSVTDGHAVTSQWAGFIDDDDPEVLEDEVLQAAGTGEAVVVVEASATVIDDRAGLVRLDGPIMSQQIQAFFAKSDPADEVLSWFGPTETLELLDFARGVGR